MELEPNKGIGEPIKLFGLSGIVCLLFYGITLLLILLTFFISAVSILYAIINTIVITPLMVLAYHALKKYEKTHGYKGFIRSFYNKSCFYKHKVY
ncbi:MAG: hypothetical protein ACK5HU_03305 [Flavobacteriales bacterium]